MSEPRIVTPQEAHELRVRNTVNLNALIVGRGFVADDLARTVATEPERTRAAVADLENAYEVLYTDLEEALAAIDRVRAVMADPTTAWAPNNSDALSVSMQIEPISVGPMMVVREALEAALKTPERAAEDRTRAAVVKALDTWLDDDDSPITLRQWRDAIENGAEL